MRQITMRKCEIGIAVEVTRTLPRILQLIFFSGLNRHASPHLAPGSRADPRGQTPPREGGGAVILIVMTFHGKVTSPNLLSASQKKTFNR
jgi:hypothetical protein